MVQLLVFCCECLAAPHEVIVNGARDDRRSPTAARGGMVLRKSCDLAAGVDGS